MRLYRFYPLVIFIGVAVVSTADILSDNGKAGKTGSPGETNCSNCHSSYTVNSGSGAISIASSDMSNWEYVPGQTYHLSVTVSRPTNSLFGFGFEALRATGNTPAGSFVITNPSSTSIKNATVAGLSRPNVVHTLNGGLSSDAKSFQFDWIAPSTNVGNIVFYASGNACNNNGNEFGDYVYTTSRLITPASSLSILNASERNTDIKVYPIPTKQELLVEYSIGKPSQVIVSITTLAGAKLLTLLNEVQIGGAYVQQFNLGSKLAKGVYLLSVEAENKKGIKKIIIQ